MVTDDGLIHQSTWDKIKNRWFIYRHLRPFVRARSKLSDDIIHDNIYLFSYQRSGSTWLGEVLCKALNAHLIFEPLWRGPCITNGEMPHKSLGRCDELRDLSFYYYQPIPENAVWPEATKFMIQLMKLQIEKLGVFSDVNWDQVLPNDRFVFKFCHGNLLLPWFVKKFDINPIILIRHPCAVINSQLKMPHWQRIRESPHFAIPAFKYSEIYEKHESVYSQIKSIEENLAFQWAIGVSHILAHTNLSKYIVFYENLYTNFETELDKILQKLGFNGVNVTQIEPNKPSSSYGDNSTLGSPKQLSKWKNDLSSEQIQRIMKVIKSMDIKIYDLDPFPIRTENDSKF